MKKSNKLPGYISHLFYKIPFTNFIIILQKHPFKIMIGKIVKIK